jgi:glutamyl-tRNA reductase
MHITLVGINHTTAPVAVRERFTFSPEELAVALPRFGGAAILLSTCNRTEVYLASHHPIAAGSVIALLRELKDAPDVPDEVFYHLAEQDAVRHLFRVAAGVESMVLGEAEILGQVRGAFSAATAAGTHNAVLSQLFHEAIRVGRRARSETGIGRNAVSVSSTAVALARKVLGDLSQRTVLVVSAGETGKLTARNLARNGASRLLVTNRRPERARMLATELDGEPIAFERLSVAMADADIVISSSAATEFLIGREEVTQAVANRNGRPLLMIDIAVPRDIDPVVREFPQVHLYDIDDLQAVVEENINLRRQELEKVEQLVDEGVEHFSTWLRERGVVPTVAALRERADSLRSAELTRTLKRAPELSAEQRSAVEAMSNALVKKLLHDPIARLKGADGERYVGTLRELFALDDEPSPNGAALNEE